MHQSALSYAEQFFRLYCSDVKNDEFLIVEVGAQDVNGSIRAAAPDHARYVGLDFADGKGVDIVIDNEYEFPLETSSADILVSSSCLEHSQFFWLTFLEMCRVVKPGGFIYLNAPSNGIFHRYPVDCWRFYPDAGHALAAWAKKNGHDIELVESFIGEQSAEGIWNDFVAVFLKKEATHKSNVPTELISDAAANIENVHAQKGLTRITTEKQIQTSRDRYELKVYISGEQDDDEFSENRIVKYAYLADRNVNTCRLDLPPGLNRKSKLRLDISDAPILINLLAIELRDEDDSAPLWKWSGTSLEFVSSSGVHYLPQEGHGLSILCTDDDPRFLLNIPATVFHDPEARYSLSITFVPSPIVDALPIILRSQKFLPDPGDSAEICPAGSKKGTAAPDLLNKLVQMSVRLQNIENHLRMSMPSDSHSKTSASHGNANHRLAIQICGTLSQIISKARTRQCI